MEKFLVGPPSKSRKRVNVDVVDFVDNNNEPPDPKILKTPFHHEAHESIADGKNTETQSKSYIFNGTFFKIIHSEKQNIKAQCMHCPKVISGFRNSTRNFLSHVKRLHQSLLGLLKKVKEERSYNNQVVQLVFDYIAAEMRPLSTVEKPTLKALIEGLANNKSVRTPDRRTITKELELRYLDHKTHLIKQLKKQAYVCITADLWTSNNRSYMGMTLHYILENKFVRKSHLLCCKRFMGKHVYLSIATCITSVLNDFQIEIPKVSHIVTDNASNFVKAFEVYGNGTHALENEAPNLEDENITSVCNDSHDEYDDEDDDGCSGNAGTCEDVQIVNLEPILGFAYHCDDLESSDGDAKEIILPSHMRCAVHTLNLVETADANKALLDKFTDYKKIYRSTFGKLQVFWNLTSWSTVASDLTCKLCKCKFPVPIMTRWNSYYDATNKILQQKDKLGELFSKLKLPKLKSAEWIFIEEYCRVTEPLACALDKLQGEIQCFLGFVAPTLFVLRIRLMELSSLVYCTALKLAIMTGIEKRFQHLFDMENYPTDSKAFVLSAMSHPKFKTKWIPERLVNYCKEMFIAEFTLLISNTTNKDSESDTDDSDDFFYKSLAHNNNENTIRKLENFEVEMYFNCKKKELTMLESFSTVKKMFLKYNTTLPSSAPVERLFSLGAQILIPRRNKLNDKHFEMLLTCRSKLIEPIW